MDEEYEAIEEKLPAVTSIMSGKRGGIDKAASAALAALPIREEDDEPDTERADQQLPGGAQPMVLKRIATLQRAHSNRVALRAQTRVLSGRHSAGGMPVRASSMPGADNSLPGALLVRHRCGEARVVDGRACSCAGSCMPCSCIRAHYPMHICHAPPHSMHVEDESELAQLVLTHQAALHSYMAAVHDLVALLERAGPGQLEVAGLGSSGDLISQIHHLQEVCARGSCGCGCFLARMHACLHVLSVPMLQGAPRLQ